MGLSRSLTAYHVYTHEPCFTKPQVPWIHSAWLTAYYVIIVTPESGLINVENIFHKKKEILILTHFSTIVK